MSFPNIPDIKADIDICLEDSINMLLASIAMEEMSLSRLMDAETEKINCALENCRSQSKIKGSMLRDVTELNKSVDDTLKNIIKLQMLLQFKLEDVKELICCTSSTTTTTTTTTTTCSTTTCSTSSSCSTTTHKDGCCLVGCGRGLVSNRCDEYYNVLATLYAVIHCSELEKRRVRYSVGNEGDNLCMTASGYRIQEQYSDSECKKLVICGCGNAVRHIENECNIASQVTFTLTVIKRGPDCPEFRMQINSCKDRRLNHDSGIVRVVGGVSNLRMTKCTP